MTRVLIVEDDPMTRQLLEMFLEESKTYGEPMGAYWRIYDNRGDHDNTLIYGSNLPRGLFWLDETTVTLNGETITYPAGLYASDTFVGSGGAITQNYNGAHGTNFTYMSVSPDNQTYITNNSRLVTAAKMHLVFDDPANPDVPTGWAFGSELADEGSTDRARGLRIAMEIGMHSPMALLWQRIS